VSVFFTGCKKRLLERNIERPSSERLKSAGLTILFSVLIGEKKLKLIKNRFGVSYIR
jgi:hypothetical protein